MSISGNALRSGRAWGPLSWPLRHIRWKIILPYAVLTASLAAVGSYLATDLVTGSLSERFDNQLAESARVAADGMVEKERAHLEDIRTISFTEGVGEAARAGDAEALRRLVEPIAVNSIVERLEVLGPQGERLIGLQLTDETSLSYEAMSGNDVTAQWPVVKSILGGEVDSFGDKHAQIVAAEEGLVLYTAGPIHDSAGLVGVALVGTSIENLVKEIKVLSLADVTIYDFNGTPLVSTLDRGESRNPQEVVLDVDPALAEKVQNGEAIRETRTLYGRGYDLVYGRLKVRNEVVGLYSTALPSDFIFSAANTTRTQIVIVFGLGIAAVTAIGFYLTHRLTAPILKLVRTARLVASGDLTVRSGVRSGDEIGILATSFDDMTEKLQKQHLSTIRALTSAIDARDPYTLGHSLRVGQLSMMLGRELEMDEAILARLEIGGYLHDIGKIGIRDAVLLKPGALTEEERRTIEEHPGIGISILEAVDLPLEVIQFVEAHHERLDGSGYPHGLEGLQVPEVARIAAVADIYDAVTTERPYRAPMDPEEALALLRSQSGRLLDPQVVHAFAVIQYEWERRCTEEQALRGIALRQSESRVVRA